MTHRVSLVAGCTPQCCMHSSRPMLQVLHRFGAQGGWCSPGSRTSAPTSLPNKSSRRAPLAGEHGGVRVCFGEAPQRMLCGWLGCGSLFQLAVPSCPVCSIYFRPDGGKKGILGKRVEVSHEEFPTDWFEG